MLAMQPSRLTTSVIFRHLNYTSCLLLCLLGCVTVAQPTAAAERPNVLVVITDDQGYGDLSCHGNSMLQTPNLDRLASQSLRMTNFHVEPTCAETRAALMTGKYPASVGVWHTVMGRSLLDSKAVTMPQLFQAAGYRTGMFGKWHLGDNYPYRPIDRGFAKSLYLGGGGVGQTPDVWGNDYFDDVYNTENGLQPVRGYCTDVFFEAATDFIHEESDQPFFCYVATNAPHSPYVVDPAFRQPYLDKGVPEPMASFYGMIANIDVNLGRLLAALEQKQLDRNTIVVFMTDNGTAAGVLPANQDANWKGYNAGMRGTKGEAYEGGHHVPCFVRLPDGAQANREIGELTAHIDVLPTLAELCGVKLPGDQAIDGASWLPLINDTGTSKASVLRKPFAQRTHVVQSHRVEVPRKWTKSSVMQGAWRLVDGEELYDLTQDPGQQKNIATNHQDVVKSLRATYEAWWDKHVPDAEKSLVRIPLGAAQTTIVRLTGHDWHGPRPAWDQTFVRRQPVTNGRWAVRVEQPGTYQFWIARQPLEEPLALGCREVTLRVGDVEQTVQVNPTAVLAPISMNLQAGDYWLQNELKQVIAPKSDSAAEETQGAFFVYAAFVGDPQKSQPLPSWLSAGDRIAWLGGTLIERAQIAGGLEASLLARAPASGLTFCNLGWSGDDVRGRARNVFGDLNEGKSRRLRDLDLAAPSVVIVAYGMSEALDDRFDVNLFKNELAELVRLQTEAGRRIVLCRVPNIDVSTAAAVENSNMPRIRWEQVAKNYGSRRNEFNAAIEAVAVAHGSCTVVDLPAIDSSWFEAAQYLSSVGYRQWSEAVASSLLGGDRSITDSQYDRIANQSVEASRIFFDLHRPQNETYLTLFRKHEQGNNAVEATQNRPLMAELQLQMLYSAVRQ